MTLSLKRPLHLSESVMVLVVVVMMVEEMAKNEGKMPGCWVWPPRVHTHG